MRRLAPAHRSQGARRGGELSLGEERTAQTPAVAERPALTRTEWRRRNSEHPRGRRVRRHGCNAVHRSLLTPARLGVDLSDPSRSLGPVHRGSDFLVSQRQGVPRALHHHSPLRDGKAKLELRSAAEALLLGMQLRRPWPARPRHARMRGLVHDRGGDFRKRMPRIDREGQLHQALARRREESAPAGEALDHQARNVLAEPTGSAWGRRRRSDRGPRSSAGLPARSRCPGGC